MRHLTDCELTLSEESYCIYAPSYESAVLMVNESKSIQALAASAVALGKLETKVFYPGCNEKEAFLVPASFARCQTQEPSKEVIESARILDTSLQRPSTSEPIIKSAIDFDWNAVMSGENPTYISQMKTQANLFVSPAAVAAQSDKPPSDLLSDTAHSLNYEHELLYRCRTVVADGNIHQYEYEGLRWFNEDGIWTRKRMNFVSNVWNIEYLNRHCWMEEVLSAVPVGA